MLACKLCSLTLGAFILCTHIVQFFQWVWLHIRLNSRQVLGMNLQWKKKKQRNIEGLSNDQKSQMHVYIALKKMYIVAQMKTIWRHRISQSSYTWKEVIGNFCTVVSPENVHISEGQKLHRGWEIMCVCMWHTQNRTFSKLTLKKSCAQTLSFLSFTCKFCKE